MSRFHIETQGCKVNLADSLGLADKLCAAGHERARGAADADLIVLNSCSVTGRADADARRLVGRLRRRNPHARLVVTGCLAETAPATVRGWAGVSDLVPNRDKGRLLPILGGSRGASDISDGTLWDAPRAYPQFPASGHTRAFVKVQDGCDASCSFCIIPQTRGVSRSLPVEDVVASVSALGRSGAEEVVLTGIHLGHYGRDRGESLSLLLASLERLARPRRIRLTSIEPSEVSAELLAFFANRERFAPHFHVPLQSGSDPVLRRMRRPYTAVGYARAIERISSRIEAVGIGADVIVGFPGESPADFAATRSLLRSLPLTYLHVFSFSPRAGTVAAELPERVSEAEITARSRELHALGAELEERFAARLRGGGEIALTMPGSPGETPALAGCFVKLVLPGGLTRNQLWRVKLGARSERGIEAMPMAQIGASE